MTSELAKLQLTRLLRDHGVAGILNTMSKCLTVAAEQELAEGRTEKSEITFKDASKVMGLACTIHSEEVAEDKHGRLQLNKT